jgi:transposase
MSRHIQGATRTQLTLLPECLDDFVNEDNAVRVIDVFVDSLDLKALGFENTDAAVTGRPGYHPGVLLKIYIYGYLNRIQSSRRLERETLRNVEVMWLTGRLAPDFKTIADFRRDNGIGIRNACKQFVLICRKLHLLENASVAVDGSKFKAVNSRDKNFTPHKVVERIKQVEQSITRYLEAMEIADRTGEAKTEARVQYNADKLKNLKVRLEELKAIEELLQQNPNEQISLTDTDSRSMATSGRGTGIVGYNVQASVDTVNHLIVTHEVTNIGHDRTQLVSMGLKTKKALGNVNVEVIADRGYYKGLEILGCVNAGITPWVPRSMTTNKKALGSFDKRDFVYLEASDEYQCPAGEKLARRHSSIEDEMVIHVYYAKVCQKCALKSVCTTGKERRIRRWEHERVLDEMNRRLEDSPGKMKERRCTVEHVFGTLKSWMGSTHFLTKRLPNVGTEMSLHVLAYNLRRVLSILGTTEAMKLISAL